MFRTVERKFRYFLFIVIILFLFGCLPGPIASLSIDMSSNENLWGGLKKNGSFITSNKLFLINVVSDSYPFIECGSKLLVPPSFYKRRMYYKSPETINEYLRTKDNWPDVIDILDEGTVLNCDKLIKYIPIGYNPSIYIYTAQLKMVYRKVR